MRSFLYKCPNCSDTDRLSAPLNVTSDNLRKVNGVLAEAVILALSANGCKQCVYLPREDNVSTPTVLMLELGCIDSANKQDPPVIISEAMNVYKDKYVLTGAIMVRPGHFYAIVKVDNTFVMIDDMKTVVEKYPTFSAAVMSDETIKLQQHTTTKQSPGIYILVYIKCESPVRSPLASVADCNDTTASSFTTDKHVGASESSKVCANEEAEKALVVNNSATNVTNATVPTIGKVSHIASLNSIPNRSTNVMLVPSQESGTKKGCDETQTVPKEIAKAILPETIANSGGTDPPTVAWEDMTGTCSYSSVINTSMETGSVWKPRTDTGFQGSQLETESIGKPHTDTGFQSSPLETASVGKPHTDTGIQGPPLPTCDKTLMVLGKVIATTTVSGNIFVKCSDMLPLTNSLYKRVTKRGFHFMDQKLLSDGFLPSHHFILHNGGVVNDSSTNKKKKRSFMSLKAVTHMLTKYYSNDNMKLIEALDGTCTGASSDSMVTTPITEAENVSNVNGTITINDNHIKFKVVPSREGDVVYLNCLDLFHAVDIDKVIKKRGFTTIDKWLSGTDIDPSNLYLTETGRRVWINAVSFFNVADKCQSVLLKKAKSIKDKLFRILWEDMAKSSSLKKQMLTPNRKKFSSKVTVLSSPKWRRKMNSPRKTARRRILSRKVSTGKQLKASLLDIVQKNFSGNKELFLRTLASMITDPKQNTDAFDGSLTLADIEYLLKSKTLRKKLKGKQVTCLEKLVKSTAPTLYNISPMDVIHIEQNFSGTRLFEQLRKRLPDIIPTQRVERSAKKVVDKEFQSVLLPRRTSTGWRISLQRLLDVLSLKYNSLEGKAKHWKVYGDGREIGARQSTFIGINILNNEALLHGVKFQSSLDIYPINIFYESDNRDNIEENLGNPTNPQHINKVLANSNDQFYLSGDEMFLEAILDGSNELSPLSEDGWNIYSKSNKASKGEVSADGFRLGLEKKIDREHPDSILNAIPTPRVVLCILHAITRIVEKLLYLEIQNVQSESNKETQRGRDGDAFRQISISNMEANISRRGVRQGNFVISFDKAGNPEPISLSKDYALAILEPASDEFPHPLHMVVGCRTIDIHLPQNVKEHLKLRDSYTEIEFVQLIWDHFRHMVIILKKDPQPAVHPDDLDLKCIQDHSWGYTAEDIQMYKLHAESFYQLYRYRYSSKALTPYMMKLIDHVPELMERLPYPIARFESEGGENTNHFHNRFYFLHTTRHGGRFGQDPILASFRNMWQRLCYEIEQCSLSLDPQQREISQKFMALCTLHCAATKIQTWVRPLLVRRRLKSSGVDSILHLDENTRHLIQLEMNDFCKPSTYKLHLLDGCHFILTGKVPGDGRTKKTQEDVKMMIKQNGGKVKNKIPLKRKLSARKYIVLCESLPKKVPLLVRNAIARGFPIVKYDFLYSSVTDKELKPLSQYMLDTREVSRKIQREVSITKRHFPKRKTLISVLKRKDKIAPRKKRPIIPRKFPVTPAQYYVAQRSSEKKLSLTARRQHISALFREWNELPGNTRTHITRRWRTEKNKVYV